MSRSLTRLSAQVYVNGLLFAFLVLLAGCVTEEPTVGPKRSISLSPASVSIVAGDSLSVSANGDDLIFSESLEWSLLRTELPDHSDDSLNRVQSIGALSGSGAVAHYVSSDRISSKPLFVTIRVRFADDSTVFADCTVQVNPKAPNAHPGSLSLVVTPQSVTLHCNESQQFLARLLGTTNVGISWRVVSGPGSIGRDGKYSAPAFLAAPSDLATIEAVALADTTVRIRSSVLILQPLSAPDTVPCFRSEIHPILISNCSMMGCHNPTDHIAGLDFTTYSGLMTLVTPGDTGRSELWRRLTHVLNPLSLDQRTRVAKWILGGAANSSCTSGDEFDTLDVRYSNYVRPTIDNYCLGCHSGRALATYGGVDLSSCSGVQDAATSGLLEAAICHQPHFTPMPKYGEGLDARTINRIRAWIHHGAPEN